MFDSKRFQFFQKCLGPNTSTNSIVAIFAQGLAFLSQHRRCQHPAMAKKREVAVFVYDGVTVFPAPKAAPKVKRAPNKAHTAPPVDEPPAAEAPAIKPPEIDGTPAPVLLSTIV